VNEAHTHIRPRYERGQGYVVDTYGGNGKWISASEHDTLAGAKKMARRIRRVSLTKAVKAITQAEGA
jgi:hypothetical protein